MFEPLVQQHAIGEIGQRVVVGHIFDLDLGSPLLGDVFMGRDPAAVRHRPVTDLEGASVLQFDDAVGGFGGYRNIGAPVQIFVSGHRGKAARFKAHVDDFGERGAGTDAVARQIIHVDVAVVADDQPVRRVEKAQSLRHIVDRGIELQVSDAQVLFLLLAKLALHFQARADFLPPGDVLMGGHAAAARQRVNRKGDDPAVGEFLDGRSGDDDVVDALTDVVVRGGMDLEPQFSRCRIRSLTGVPGFTCSDESR